MDSRKFILQQTAIVAIGQAVCIGIMLGVYALLGRFDRSVWLGGIFGGLIAVANFFIMAVCANMAADKAEKQDVKGGTALIQISTFLRLAVAAVILFALIKSGLCHVLTAVLPLAFTRPVITIVEFFRKGSSKS